MSGLKPSFAGQSRTARRKCPVKASLHTRHSLSCHNAIRRKQLISSNMLPPITGKFLYPERVTVTKASIASQ